MNRTAENLPRRRFAAPALLTAAALASGLLATASAPAAAAPDAAAPDAAAQDAAPSLAQRPAASFRITMHEGTGTEGKVIESVRLNCFPTTGSTHPRPGQACRLLARAGGQFSKLPHRNVSCPMVHEPVTVTAKGRWKGTVRIFAQIYSNTCKASAQSSGVFNLNR